MTSTRNGGSGEPRLRTRSWGADGWSVVELAGELDLASVALAEAELTRAEREAAGVVLDLRALEFIDSTGLRLVVRAAGRLHERGGRLVVARAPRAVHRVFELAGTRQSPRDDRGSQDIPRDRSCQPRRRRLEVAWGLAMRLVRPASLGGLEVL